MTFRFLQTGDWQLGMTRHFFSEGTQERYSQARFDAVRKMGQIAEQEQCQFMLVCGDVFDSNQVSRATVARALEALRDVPVPVYIVPGNHDPLDAASVYDSSVFLEKQPGNVHVVRDAVPFQPVVGLELVAAPWFSKRPAANPVAGAISSLAATDKPRILAAHGVIDIFTPDKDSPLVITQAELESALRERLVQYVALGDRHSAVKIGETEQIWFAGSPETTDTNDIHAGFALVVDIAADRTRVHEVPVGEWKFLRETVNLDSQADVDAFGRRLEGIASKESTVLKLDLVGSLSLTESGAFEDLVAFAKDVFAAVILKDDLLVLPDDTDFADTGFSGFAGGTVARLREMAAGEDEDAGAARDALKLMLRLSRSGS